MKRSVIWAGLAGVASLVFLLSAVPSEVAAGKPKGASGGKKKEPPKEEAKKPTALAAKEGVGAIRGDSQLLYTTYFYTANEAVVHGYEPETRARIISLEQGGKTIWEGSVGQGETILVPTGQGVFGFLSEKKASILVGTPSSCTAVGYFVKNQEGSFRSQKFYAQLPAAVSLPDARVLVWAWEDTNLTLTDRTSGATLYSGPLKAGGFYEIKSDALAKMGSHVLEASADTRAISLQIYYDEGFIVPAEDGRGAGRLFYTYVGEITTGENDLLIQAHDTSARVKVEDVVSGKEIWSGEVKAGAIQALTLAKRYVRVSSDVEISLSVNAYQHYQGLYAEHHFSMGMEGTGIENHFLTTSPSELWIFSYFDNNTIKVLDAASGKELWKGTLGAGNVQGLTPGFGYYRVTSSKGISVLSGASACGGEYSPAAGLFAVDEELLQVFKEIQEERRAKAKAEGRPDDEAMFAAPLSNEEIEKAQKAIQKRTGRKKKMSGAEIQERLDSMKTY